MFDKKFEETINEISNGKYDEKTKIFLKSALLDLAMEHAKDLKEIEKGYETRIVECEEKIKQIEQEFRKLERELFEDEEDLDLEPITCPYCNANFMIQRDHTLTELECPECRNTIVLDWGAFDDDM